MSKKADKVNKQRYEIKLLKIFFWCQQLFIYRRRNYQTNETRCNHSIWNLVRLFLSNLLYRKKEITVKKKSIWSHDRTDNNDWCKGGCECKLTATFAESFYLLLRLKPRSAKRLSRHSAFMGKWPTLSYTC